MRSLGEVSTKQKTIANIDLIMHSMAMETVITHSNSIDHRYRSNHNSDMLAEIAAYACAKTDMVGKCCFMHAVCAWKRSIFIIAYLLPQRLFLRSIYLPKKSDKGDFITNINYGCYWKSACYWWWTRTSLALAIHTSHNISANEAQS